MTIAQPADIPTAAPPAKRVRREYPWRPEFARDFGVRPVQVDAVSGEALLAECRFCVSFGREPPEPLGAPPVNKAGQTVKSRARTRNVAHWKYPFRTDNMRSHHLQQHGRKWAEYAELLELAKQEVAAGGGPSATERDETSASHHLSVFFGEPSAGDGQVIVATPATPKRANGTTKAAIVAAAQATTGAAGQQDAAKTALLPTLVKSTIVDVVLASLIDIPARDFASRDAEVAMDPSEPLLVPVAATTSANSDETGPITHYSIECRRVRDLEDVANLFAAGLGFSQIAALRDVTYMSNKVTLNRSAVVAHARALVASSLQRIGQLMEMAWAYSIQLTVGVPRSDKLPASLRVRVRVPVDRYRDEKEFHVATLALHQSAESKDDVAKLLRALLLSLDPKYDKKVLSVSVDGVADALGVHAELPNALVEDLASPKVGVFDGRQVVESCIHTAWVSFVDQSTQDPEDSFTAVLSRLIEHIRTDNACIQNLGHCPAVAMANVRSVFHVLKWLIARRDALVHGRIEAPVWWWIVAHVLCDVWTDCFATASKLLAEGRRSEQHVQQDIIVNLAKSLKIKTSITTESCVEANEDPAVQVKFDDDARTATLVVAVAAKAVRLSWTSKATATCLRSLNVSTRRVFGELGKDSTDLRVVEREITRSVLVLVGYLERRGGVEQTQQARPPPPTLPLDFVCIDPEEVVDFVESHSSRLELTFPTLFLDNVTREIRELKALATSTEKLRGDLERAARPPPSSSKAVSEFTSSWDLVPQLVAVRTLAAGLATALPTIALAGDNVLPFGRAENEQMPLHALADLTVEAHAHAHQLELLHRATMWLVNDESTVV